MQNRNNVSFPLGSLLCALLLACSSYPASSPSAPNAPGIQDLSSPQDFATTDAQGCMGASECECRLANLKAVCHFDNHWVDDLKCDPKMPTCVAACLRDLKSCADVTCNYCSTCDCAGGDTYFTRCVSACR